MTDPTPLDLRSHDLAADQCDKLLRLFPEIRIERGQFDFESLKLALGGKVDSGREDDPTIDEITQARLRRVIRKIARGAAEGAEATRGLAPLSFPTFSAAPRDPDLGSKRFSPAESGFTTRDAPEATPMELAVPLFQTSTITFRTM